MIGELAYLSSGFDESSVEACSQGQLIPWCFDLLHMWAEWSLAAEDLRQRATDAGGGTPASVPRSRGLGVAPTVCPGSVFLFTVVCGATGQILEVLS